MKLKLLVIILLTSLFSLHSTEEKNFNFASGLNVTNFTLEPDKYEPHLIYDLLIHIDVSLGYNYKIPGSDSLSIRTDLSVIPFRAFSDLSLSLAYTKGKHQFSVGPSIAYDSYFFVLRAFNILLSFSSAEDNQIYWIYTGIDAAYRYRVNDDFGFYIKYKQSLFNLSSMFVDVINEDVDRYNFASAGIMIYF